MPPDPMSEPEKKDRKPALQRLRGVWPDLWALIYPRRGLLSFGLLLMVINRVSGMALPGTAKFLIDDVVLKHRNDLLLPLVFGLIGATVIQGISSFSLTQLL